MTKKTTKTTAGEQFDINKKYLHFVAGPAGCLETLLTVHGHGLIAINELRESNLHLMSRYLNAGAVVLIDSGIFALVADHHRKHRVSMNEALSLAPHEIDGFDDLYKMYVAICKEFGDKCWGYIELDQGGRENKIRTRARLEKLGLRPIPVYHPQHDGWDYFDHLAKNYDRICIGEMVQSDRFTKLRLIATVAERKKKYPGLWIHLLGFTPNAWLNAYDIESCDSSTWSATTRWAGYIAKAAGQSLGHLNRDFQYMLGADVDADNGHRKGWRHGAYAVHFQECNWRAARREVEKLEAK